MQSRDAKSQSQNDLNQFSAIEELFGSDPIALIEKIEAFPKYVTRQSIAKFITKYEIFKKILYVNGSIVECGVLYGAGLMAWAKLSSIFEPVNHTRKIIGFDTFQGFPGLSEKDGGSSNLLKTGGMMGDYESVQEAINAFDLNRAVSHIPKVVLVKGDICETAQKYVADNPYLVVSLLYLDCDIYEPTKKAIEVFMPRMPKGAVIVFDELNAGIFHGETRAVDETIGLQNLRIERFDFDSYVSYAVLQ